MAKQFGLFIPGKQKPVIVPRKTIFDEDNELEDDEESDSFQPRAPGPGTSAIPSKVKRETKLTMEKALEEDPNVFDYDGVYDQMKAASSSKKKEDKPKYMENLLKAAEIRKRDHERREEKKIQKEREEEGDEFREKEEFVTAAYKEKLKELRDTEEKERREKQLEEMFDVKKQSDLSGFHRHLLNQHIGEEAVPEISRDRYGSAQSSTETSFKTRKVKNQSLRSRREEISDEEGDEKDAQPSVTGETEIVEKESQPETTELPVLQEPPIPAISDEKKEPEEPAKVVLEVKEPVDPKKMIAELFEKRTVGEKFEEAVRKYEERKQLRGS